MKKQTKLVAVLSTAALLAIGASMTSFAATGWNQEDGTWVYYDKSGGKVSDQWEKSGDNWYYLDSDGNMASDQLIDDGTNYYYVDTNGVMVSNKWVAIDNEDAGQSNEPDHYWYYFQANGKALTNGDNSGVALKTINGKKYAFDTEGKMLYGWVDKNSAERLDNTQGDAFLQGDYYFGGQDDGAMTVGWLQTDITYADATNDSEYNQIAPVFTDDQDQTRWFYFLSNGKKVKADTGKGTKDKTINGKKYSFDEAGAMVAEWSRNITKATTSTTGNATWSRTWRYYNSVEDGARSTRGWFKVVAAELLDPSKYDDDDDAWYYADGKGNIYAGEFKTINGKEFAFNEDGRMLDGLNMIKRNGSNILDIKSGDDVAGREIDTEDGFNKNAGYYAAAGYGCYYFGDDTDGAMKTGNARADIDGTKYNFNFLKAGGHKGAGKVGEDNKKLYNSGKLVAANSDIKYQVAFDRTGTVVDSNTDVEDISYIKGYKMYEDAADLARSEGYFTMPYTALENDQSFATYSTLLNGMSLAEFKKESGLSYNDKFSEIEVYARGQWHQDGNNEWYLDPFVGVGLPKEFKIVNTSGNVSDKNAKVKDGNGVCYKLYNGNIICTYTED